MLTHLRYKLCDKLLLLARKCILINWIKAKPRSVTLWCRKIFSHSSTVLEGNEELFMKVRSPLFNYLRDELSRLLEKGQLFLQRSPTTGTQTRIVSYFSKRMNVFFFLSLFLVFIHI